MEGEKIRQLRRLNEGNPILWYYNLNKICLTYFCLEVACLAQIVEDLGFL